MFFFLSNLGCSNGLRFHNLICKFDFILGVAVCSFVLNLTNSLSSYLQTVNLDIIKAYEHINLIISKMNGIRKNAEKEFDDLFEEASELAIRFGIEPKLPRVVGTQKYRSNIPTSDAKEYYRVSLFIPFLDEVLSHLDNRFSEHQPIITSLFNIVPARVVKLTKSDFEELVLFYANDLKHSVRAVILEITLWSQYWKEKNDKPSNALDAIIACNEQLFPNVFTLLQILITIPVTTATAERSFSTLRRVKNYLRNRMEEERLSALALLSVYKNEVNVEEIIDIFISKNRRLNF